MRQQHTDAQEYAYPRIRRWTAAAYRSVHHKPIIHGLIAVDVTTARAILREHKARTGESLSFTAFLTACLGKAVAEHKDVQAMRNGSRRLVVFDDVDVWIPVEHDVSGHKVLVPHIVRAANRKSVRAIHDEIRAAQRADITQVAKGPRMLPAALFGFAIWLFWRIGRTWPRYQKRAAGTVGLTAVGMFGKGAGWGIPPPFPTPLMITVGGIGKKQEAFGGEVVTREYLSLTISVDHDIVDGAPAARFAQQLKDLIESSYGLDAAEIEPERTAAQGVSKQQVSGAGMNR